MDVKGSRRGVSGKTCAHLGLEVRVSNLDVVAEVLLQDFVEVGMWVGGAASGATRKKATDACRLQGGATPHEASDAWVGLRAAET